MEKMLAGEMYQASDPELVAGRRRARALCARLASEDQRDEVIRELLGRAGRNVWIEPPFFCDYGSNIHVGNNVFFNFNCVILDPARVRIGDNVFFGPAVQIYTATHPLDAAERATGLEFAKPIEIGSDVWIGGGAILCPGVTIGPGSVVGAGSVVTRDVPAGVVAAGNPCRVMRRV
jgi:maltose O-acetyltransferase